MEKNVSKAIVKRNAVKELNSILKSPFAVMNLINKNRESENIKPLMDLYKIEKIEKIELSMLLHVTTGGAPVFCKLQKISDIEFLDGNELKVILIGKTYYEYIPIKFSVSAFFQSLEGAINNDVLFGEVWSRTDKLGLRDRSLVTITSLISQGITDSSLTYHLQTAKQNGITRTEISEMLWEA